MKPLTVLPFGGCLTHRPLDPIARRKRQIRYPRYGRPLPSNTFGEMFQAVDFLRRECKVPRRLRPLCNLEWYSRPPLRAPDFRDVDVALLEPALGVEMVFRGLHIHRAAIRKHVLSPIEALNPEGKKQVDRWLRIGHGGFNEAVRADAAERLVGMIPRAMRNADLARDVIMEARSSQGDIMGGFRRMRDLLGCPIGVVAFVFQYLPDGRALSWPAGFREDVVAAAKEFGFPIFDPSEVVNRHGVEVALASDLRHYNRAFRPIMAEALMEFAQSVAGVSRAAARDRAEAVPRPLLRRIFPILR